MEQINRRGKRAIIGSCMSIFWSGAMIFGYPGLMATYWRKIYAVDATATGIVMTRLLFSLGIFMFFSGKWHMKLGTGKSMLIGTGIIVIALLALNIAQSMTLVYVFGFLNGVSSCFIYGPGLTTAQNWFPQKRGLYTGIINLLFGISGAIITPVLAIMMNNMGYIKMNYVLMVIIVITNLIASKLTEMPDKSNMSDEEKIAYAQLMEEVKSAKGGQIMAESKTVKEALHTREFWFLWLTWCFMGAAGISMVGLSTGYATKLGLSAVVVLSTFNLTNGISRIIAGTLSDIIGRNLTACISFIFAAFGYFLLPIFDSLLMLAILAAFIGFAFGTLFAISAPLASDLFGLKYFGMIFGLIFTAYGFVGGIVGPALAGYVLKLTGENYTPVFIYLGVFCVFAAILIMFAKPKK